MRSSLIFFYGSIAVFLLLSCSKSKDPLSEKKYRGEEIVAVFMSSFYDDAAKDIAEIFKDETGATVKIADFPYVTLYEKLSLDLSTNSGSFDIMQVASQWDGEFAPFMEDLSSYIAISGFDSDDIIEAVWEQSGKWEDKIVGIPHTNTPYLLAYRTDLIEEVPSTYAELFESARRVHEPSSNFYAFATPGRKEQLNTLFMIAQWAYGGRWADDDWNVAIDSEETRKALEVCKQYILFSDPGATAWGVQEAAAAFLRGDAAFCLAWPTLGVTNRGDDPAISKIVGKWAIANFPHEKTGITNLSSWNLAIPSSSKNKDIAWDFIQLFTSKQMALRMFANYGIMAARSSFWETSLVRKSKLAPHADAKALMWWRSPAGVASEAAIRESVGNYVSKIWDIEKVISYMEIEMEKALHETPPKPGIKNIRFKGFDE